MSVEDAIYPNTEVPSFFWRSASLQTILFASTLSRFFLFGLNRTEVNGLPRFLDLLRSRQDYKSRRRGLVTVSNHLSVIDDPLIWGVLPLSFAVLDGYMSHRWTLASHDICFRNKFTSHFFTLGQTLPVHRLAHSPYGGPFQATMTEAVRILSKINSRRLSFCPFNVDQQGRRTDSQNYVYWPSDCIDPFSDVAPAPFYAAAPDESRVYLAPSRYACNSYSWLHIFPEGKTHQSKDKTMRYFKWGVSRLILEPPECPDVVPIFIEGTDQVMHESRKFPRFIPRIGKSITVTFGNQVDTEVIFGDLRKRWREICDQHAKRHGSEPYDESLLGVYPTTLTVDDPEVWELRKECAKRLRDEVLKVRRSRGLPDVDPKSSLAETWLHEGPKREGRMEDDTWVKDT